MMDPALEGTVVYFIGKQFHHHAWNGLHFWDLVQPFFMFIVGVAIPLSIDKRMKQGQKFPQMLRHAVTRSLLLLIFGWALYCISAGKIVFRFQNVLAQLSITYLITMYPSGKLTSMYSTVRWTSPGEFIIPEINTIITTAAEVIICSISFRTDRSSGTFIHCSCDSPCAVATSL